MLDGALEPFAAWPVEGGSEGGSGLGLAIVRAVTAAHGGIVELANVPDGGASVVMCFDG